MLERDFIFIWRESESLSSDSESVRYRIVVSF